MWNVITTALLLVMIFILYAIKKSRADNPFILAFAGVILLIVTYLFSKNAGELWLHTNASASTISASTISASEKTHSVSDDNDPQKKEAYKLSDGNDDANTAVSDTTINSDDQEDIEDGKPAETYLTSLKQTEINMFIKVDKYCEKDNRGDTYSQGLNIYPRSDGFSSGRGFVEYALTGKYKTLKGTIYIPYESRNKQFKSRSMFRIYGDNQLLYTAPAIEGKDKPVDFAINVEDVRFLEIHMQGGWYKGDGTGLIPCICAGNLILSTESDASITKDPSLPKLYLTDLPLYDSKSLFSSLIDYLSDIDGNKYYRGDVIANGDKTGFAEFQIDDEYSTLKGRAYVPSDSAGKDFKQEACVKIYVNDELKKEITLDSKDSPIEFSADVSGAEFIKIEVSGGLYYKGDWIPGICVTDLGLY